ncbi:MAG: VRR-NUC domain-containing protein [Treponema sp.]|jgi:hypothetical protein|nr:VRR-NUC domain-containing protein [Treponema sp.]
MVRRDTPEGLVKSAILDYLHVRGFFAWNNPTGAVEVRPGQWMRFGKVGSADIMGCLPGGRFLAIECKAERGRLSGAQRDFLNEVERLGGLAIVARSFQEVDLALRRGGYINDGPLFSRGKEHDCQGN